MSINPNNVLCSLKTTNNNDLSYYQQQCNYQARKNSTTNYAKSSINSPNCHYSSYSSAILPERSIKVGFLSGQQYTATVKNEEEEKTLFNNWHESFYDTNYNQPDNSTLLTTNKRSPFENIEKRKKKRKLEREDVLFGPMPTIVASPLLCDKDDLLLNDEKILEELERITAEDDNTVYPLSPPTSPLLLSSHHFEEPDNDFILFP